MLDLSKYENMWADDLIDGKDAFQQALFNGQLVPLFNELAQIFDIFDISIICSLTKHAVNCRASVAEKFLYIEFFNGSKFVSDAIDKKYLYLSKNGNELVKEKFYSFLVNDLYKKDLRNFCEPEVFFKLAIRN